MRIVRKLKETPKDGFLYIDKNRVYEWEAKARAEIYSKHCADKFNNRHIFVMGYNAALNDLLKAIREGTLDWQMGSE
jgi:hypothetical protein